MADYSFTVDSSFKPFSFQELLAPFSLYKDSFEKAEDAYVNLTKDADKFSYLSRNLPEDSEARQIYEGYANGLHEQAEDLAKHGLSISNRRALIDYKRRYQGEIGQLETAVNNRNADILEQRNLYLKDPTTMFSYDASTSNLDSYLDGNRKPYKAYSGALLAKQASTAASALAKGLVNYSKTGKLDDYTGMWIEHSGMSADQVLQAITHPEDPSTNSILKSIVDNVVSASGIPTWGDAATEQNARRWAAQGLYSAIGQSQVHTYEDYGARMQAQIEKELAIAAAKEGNNPYGGALGDGQGTIPINVDHLLSPNMEGAQGRKNTLNALHTLGYSDDGKKVAREASWTKITYSGTSYTGTPTAQYQNVPIVIWNQTKTHKNQTLKTREQFIKDNSKAGTARELGEYYDNTILPAVSTLTGGRKLAKGSSWTQYEISKGASEVTRGTGSSYLGAFRINLGEGTKTAINNIIASTEDTDGYLSGVRKVKSWNASGNLTLDPGSVKAKEFIDDKGNLVGQPMLYSSPAMRGYVFIKNKGNIYAVPVQKLGSIGVSAQYGPNANVSKYEALIKNRDAILQDYIGRGMTPEKALNMYNNAVDNAGAGYIRDISAALSLEYKQNPYPLNTTSKTAEP